MPIQVQQQHVLKDPVARYGLFLFTNILFCIEKIAFPLYNAKVSAIVFIFPKKSRCFFRFYLLCPGKVRECCRYLSDLQLYSLVASGLHPESLFFRILSSYTTLLSCFDSASNAGVYRSPPTTLSRTEKKNARKMPMMKMGSIDF